MNEEPPTHSPPTVGGHPFADLFGRLQALSIRSRIVCWLLMFISAYRLGMPILFAAALAALPWLLLKSPPAGTR
ncbi:MAG TPA: hypothetical protein VN809_10210 [Telmatospirillum sp.]|nr:hypothetical protein [Telmatospirillum sp.]